MDKSITTDLVDLKNDSLILACINGNVRKVRQLLKYFHPPSHAQPAIIKARIDEALLPHMGVLLTEAQASCPLSVAIVCNKPAVVKALLKSKHFYTSSNRFAALILASRLGHAFIAKLLLRRPSTYPPAILNSALIQACTIGHVSTVKILLGISRIDPSEQNNCALVTACSNGFLEVTSLLLEDARVDPSFPDNEALLAAVRNRHFKIVAALLYSGKVDPSLDNGLALQIATRLEDERTIRVLLRDARLYPYIDEILGEHLRTPGFSHEIAALLYAHTLSSHIYGSPRNYRLFQHLRRSKAGAFVLHDNHYYSYEVLEQLLRCQASLGRFDPRLLRMIMDTNGIWDNLTLHETLNFVVIRCCMGGNKRWLRTILDFFATKLEPWQLQKFIAHQKAVMNLDLANLLMIAPAYTEVSLFFVQLGAADVLPLMQDHQLNAIMHDYSSK